MTPHLTPAALHDALLGLADDVFPAAVEHLGQLIRIPSLSLPSAPDGPVEASAQAVAEMFRSLIAWDQVEVISVGEGRPAFLARKNPLPGRPTVLLYAHHDVQPAGDRDQWESDPFEPEIRNGRLYGRGSADDGAGIVTHWQALSYFSQLVPDLGGIGIVVFIEGEEESGSPTFQQLLTSYRDVLSADVIIVADSDNPSPTTPALTTSLRGVVGVTVTVTTGEFPLHSGMFGGVVPDAPSTLIRLLASLHDEAGNSAIRFPLPDNRASRDVDARQLRSEAGVLPDVSLLGEGAVSDRLWWAPAITVTGFDAPATDQASNTLWPAASARISMRIPPTVSPDDAFRALAEHLAAHTPWGASLDLSRVEKGPGFVGSTTHPDIELYAECAEEIFGEALQFQGVGGTIPFIATLAETFPQATVLVTGVEDHESRAHGTNESVDVAMVERCGLTEGMFFVRFSQLR